MRLQVRLALISVAPVHDHLNTRPTAQEAATARETAHCRGHDDHEGHDTGRGGADRHCPGSATVGYAVRGHARRATRGTTLGVAAQIAIARGQR